ncbi:glutamine amidotransferase [Elusimicrobiota bacterium]
MNFNIELPVILILIPVLLAIAAMMLKPRAGRFPVRILIYLIVLMLMLKPYFSKSRKLDNVPRIGVFIDSSLSMSLEGRMDEALASAGKIVSGLKNKARVKIYEFGDVVKEVKEKSVGSIAPVSEITDISGVIKEGGVDGRVIITDGGDNTGVSPLILNELGRMPVFTIGIGSRRETPDIGIIDLKVPGFGFRDQNVKIQFTLTNNAASSGIIRVYLKKDDRIISRQVIRLNMEKEIPVSLEFVPREVGLNNYEIYLKEIKGEINTANNSRNFQLQVNRRNIRALYVAGQPSWEYSFFRRIVKSDPQIDLMTFLILRNSENITIVNEYELSLIHFPAREMFTEEIYDFDLLIYDNFAYKKFFPRSYLTHIKNFVMKGGAFIMMGGEDSFARGGYINTPIEDILPVYMNKNDSEWIVEKISPEPVRSVKHPVINLADDMETSLEIWKDMPHLEGYDTGLQAKPDATVLLKTGDGIPVLSVSNVGKGRVMAFNANTTWRWCMGLAGKGKTPYYYNRFWYKVIRYMIQSGDLKNVQIFPGKDKVKKGDSVNINIKVVDSYWEPVNKAEVNVDIETPAGKKIPLGRALSTGKDGWYHISFPVSEEGVHKIKARAIYNNRLLEEGESKFAGVSANKEFINTALNSGLLKEIAEVSKGDYWTADDLNTAGIISKVKNSMKDKKIIKKISWHNWIFYALLVFILLTEWYIRRRKGLS